MLKLVKHDSFLLPIFLIAISALTIATNAQATICVVNATPMLFGVYDTLSATPTDSTASLSVSCTPGVGDALTTSYTINLAGSGALNDPVRSMTYLSYRAYFNLYSDTGRNTVWGNGSSSAGVSSSVTSTATAVPSPIKSHTVYGQMAARQNIAPGAYTGSILVTLNY